MPTLSFGAAADMRLTDAAYGIAELQAFNVFISGFVAVRQEVVVASPMYALVMQYDAVGASLALELAGDLVAGDLTDVRVSALGVREVFTGRFLLPATGEVSGTASSVRAESLQGDLFVGFSNLSVAFDGLALSLPTDNALLAGADSVQGSAGPDWLLGYAGNDTLVAGAGDDTLDGGEGADSMLGGAGNDVYLVDSVADIVVEAAGAGDDAILSALGIVLPAEVERLTLLGADAVDGTGNAAANTITGNSAANRLSGGDGSDTLRGCAGDDTLDGGAGVDTAAFTGSGGAFIIDTDAQTHGLVVRSISGAGAANEGTDTLLSIEALTFQDSALAVSYLGEAPVSGYARGSSPAVVGLQEGGYLVAWDGLWSRGAWDGIEVRQYAADGQPLEAAHLASQYLPIAGGVPAMQSDPMLARLADGSIELVWWSRYQDTDSHLSAGVYARHLDAQGQPLGPEIAVNSTTDGWQGAADVCALAGGGFVIAWQSDQLDVTDVFAQRFDALGQRVGGEFLVNATTPWYQTSPALAGLADGGFVAAWASMVDGGVGSGILLQRFDATGQRVGAEHTVNTFVTHLNSHSAPATTALDGGGFVVVWVSYAQDGDGAGIFGQRFSAAGDALGAEFSVNADGAGAQTDPSVAATVDGGFRVSWTSAPAQGLSSIWTRAFDADGAPTGPQTGADPAIQGAQQGSAIAVLDDGVAVVAHEVVDGDVYVRALDALGNPVSVTVLDGSAAADTVVFGDARQLVSGGGGDDRLNGGGGNDTLLGGEGNDILIGGAGDDSLDAGQGLDEARWSSTRAQTTIVRQNDGSLRVTGPQGSDVLAGVERVALADQATAFDADGIGGTAYRLYQAAFDRVPDEGGLGFWMYYLDRGFDLTQAADNFLNSDEFRVMYGPNPANNEFVRLLYLHVHHREPDANGYAFWNAAMNNEGGIYGHAWTKGEVLVLFSESPENKANVIGQIQDGFGYLEWHG